MFNFIKKGLNLGLFFIAFVTLCILAGTLVPRPLLDSDAAQRSLSTFQKNEILVLSSDIHTDIAIPFDDANRAAFGFLDDNLWMSQAGDAEWLILGWGSRSFYIETPTWADLKPIPLLRALTIDQSVMHVQFAGFIDQSHPSVQSLIVGDEAFGKLRTAILGSFELNANSLPINIAGAGYHEFSRFYEAKGAFNALVGCNVWTAKMLRIAGIKTGWWTPLPQLLKASLAMHNSH